MTAGNQKEYLKGVFGSVFVYSLIDIIFTILYALVIGGVMLLYTYAIGNNSLIQEQHVLVSIQIFLAIYFFVISITTVNTFLKFKRGFEASKQE
jgi:hypothetical protein